VLELTGKPASLIRHVTDRPGHDRRYAVECSRAEAELGWQPSLAFEEGLAQTVQWYRTHTRWVERIRSGEYRGTGAATG
jgi:dTDP-glucose 4,6-dehydratase